MKKKELEIILSGLDTFKKQILDLEQYQTESDVAADLLWHAFMNKDVKGKVVGDFGCGNGVFGIGALLLGAKKVVFLDVDKDALDVVKNNVKNVEKKFRKKFLKSFSNKDVRYFKGKVDVVLTNPPFGVKKTHADKPFLLKAMDCSKVVYSFHKMETRNFVEMFVKDNEWNAKLVKRYDFPLRKRRDSGFGFWKKKVHKVDVGVWRIS